MKITTQKIHKIIQNKINVKSSKYSPSQKIDRTSYDLFTKIKGMYGIMSHKYIREIADALIESGLCIDCTDIDRGFIKMKSFQNAN